MILSLLAMLAAADADPRQEADLRCIAAMSYAISKAPEAQRAGLVGGVMFYLGRAETRDPALDLEVAMQAIVADEAAFARTLPADLRRCGDELAQRGAKLKALGSALQRRAEPAK